MNASASSTHAAPSPTGQAATDSNVPHGNPAPVYGGADLPVLLRLPDLAPTAPQRAVVPGVDHDAAIAALESANEPSNTGPNEVERGVTDRTQSGPAKQRRQRRRERAKQPVRATGLGWMPSTGQLIVAATIAGGLMLAIIVMRGNPPRPSAPPEATPAAPAADLFSAVHRTLSVQSGDRAVVATESLGAGPESPVLSESTDTALPMQAPELVSPTNRQPPMQGAPPQPPAAGNADVGELLNMASHGTVPATAGRPQAAAPSPYPTTGVAPLPPSYPPAVAQPRGWRESLPIGQSRQAQSPGPARR